MPKLKGLSHVVLHVYDLDKMVTFYRDTLGLVENYEFDGRMVFMTSDPGREDHELALAGGREGDAKLLAHIAWQVETVADVKAYYERFKEHGVPIERCVSRPYKEMGNTVSCYCLDPEGNRIEVYALVAKHDNAFMNRDLDLERSIEQIVADASGLAGR